jgi:anti-anti-sigma factor
MLEVAPPLHRPAPLVPAFKAIVQPEGDRTIVDVRGELCISTTQALASCLAGLRAEGADQFVLDLSSLEFMDSSGIRFLLTMDQLALAEGFGFAVVSGEGQPNRALELVGLSDRPQRASL